jgi:hypothetical protein
VPGHSDPPKTDLNDTPMYGMEKRDSLVPMGLDGRGRFNPVGMDGKCLKLNAIYFRRSIF